MAEFIMPSMAKQESVKDISDKIGTVPSGKTVEGQISTLSEHVITARGSITIASGSTLGTGYVYTPTNINATKYWWVGCVSPDSGGNDYESTFVERCWANTSNVAVRVNRQLRNNNTSGALTVPVAIIGVFKG